MASIPEGAEPAPFTIRAARQAGRAMHYAGAAVSVALIAGVAVWGYKLLVRDVTGIPVVRAMEGPMRLAPADPGGEIALHTGLAVNAVAARGEAAAPEDVLLLAPRPIALAQEDMELQPTAEADEVIPDEVAGLTEPDVAGVVSVSADAPLAPDDVLALADQIAAGATPMTALADGVLSDTPDGQTALPADTLTDLVATNPGAEAPEAAVDDVAAALAAAVATDTGQNVSGSGPIAVISASVPGVATALRPPARPATIAATAAVDATPVSAGASTASPVAIMTGELPQGTVLVQLGAFETPDLASQEWDKLAQRFAEFIPGKDRVVQEATSGGRSFYRLRAMGFTDLADARRFCAVLVAEEAGCIPVVVR